jgi:very-short-patch-repair endonuclease
MIRKRNIAYSENLSHRISTLRKNATPAERKLWTALQLFRQSHGIKFRRQHPIGGYIADFYCHAEKCAVEIDGASHDTKGEADKKRDAFMAQQGLRVLRFTESDVLRDSTAIVETILRDIRCPSPNPSRREGDFSVFLAGGAL